MSNPTRVFVATACFFPVPHELDDNDLIDVACDSVQCVALTREAAVAKVKPAVEAEYRGSMGNEGMSEWTERTEGDTTFLCLGEPDEDWVSGRVYWSSEACCYVRVFPLDVA